MLHPEPETEVNNGRDQLPIPVPVPVCQCADETRQKAKIRLKGIKKRSNKLHKKRLGLLCARTDKKLKMGSL